MHIPSRWIGDLTGSVMAVFAGFGWLHHARREWVSMDNIAGYSGYIFDKRAYLAATVNF